MTDTPPDSAALKRAAAAKALDYVENNMKLGLGTGSTAEAFLDVLAPRVRGGLNITGVATSERTALKARNLGITIGELDQVGELDLVVDGADEADADLNLIKGGGGAHLIEKIVATSSKKMVVIADGSKLVKRLGKYPLPVEVVKFGHATTARRIVEVAKKFRREIAPVLRMKDNAPFITDSGNYIYDCAFKSIVNPAKLATALSVIPGVVEHGLFVGIASTLILARETGVEVIEKAP
ncbi:MAG TPA: ribose-5-phosphate isomerase RpiA [Rhizomicrobium sp.]|jgi:ribose 5-phosphate isomerase A|nr:ribose-5-phosphate isomerase RpiA [Rhizomicrobium sp.]